MEGVERARRPDRDVGGLREQAPDIALTGLADVADPGRAAPRLAHPRVEPEIVHEFVRAREAPNVADARDEPDRGHGSDARDRHEASDPGVVGHQPGEALLGHADLGLERVEEPQVSLDPLALVGRQRDRREPAPAAAAERVAPGIDDEIPGEDSADPVAESRPEAHECGPGGDPPTEGLGGRVRLPDLGQVVGGQELGEGGRVDRIGLRLRVSDRPSPQRIADHHPSGMLAEELGDRPGVRRGLETDCVVGAERRRERPPALG